MQNRGVRSYLLTSAKSGEGIEELVQNMQNMIPWDDKTATVTTETFKRIKNFVLDLKEKSRRQENDSDAEGTSSTFGKEGS